VLAGWVVGGDGGVVVGWEAFNGGDDLLFVMIMSVSLEFKVKRKMGKHRSKTGPDRDRVGPKLRTEDRTEMVRSESVRSGSVFDPTSCWSVVSEIA
nr:hypothetical protein [Tanacetum cinerariifolium]